MYEIDERRTIGLAALSRDSLAVACDPAAGTVIDEGLVRRALVSVSTALLGFGASGVLLTLWGRIRNAVHLDRLLAVLAMLFGLSTVAAFWLMQHIPFDPFALVSDKQQFVTMPLYYLTASVPFFCSGMVLGLLFATSLAGVNRGWCVPTKTLVASACKLP